METWWTEKTCWRGSERKAKKGKNSLPQLADLGNPAILQQPEAVADEPCLSHLSSNPALSIFLPFFPPALILQMSWPLSFYFFLPCSFVLTTVCFFFSPSPLFPSNCSFSFYLSVFLPPALRLCLSLSGCPDLSDYSSSQTTAPSGLISHLQVWCQPLGQQVVFEPTCRQHLVLCWTWLGCMQRTGRKDWLKKQRGRLILLSRQREWWREWVGW